MSNIEQPTTEWRNWPVANALTQFQSKIYNNISACREIQRIVDLIEEERRLREKLATRETGPKPQSVYYSDRARSLRRAMQERPKRSDEAAMAAQSEILDALFHQLTLENAAGSGMTERDGLMIALRVQRQFHANFQTLERSRQIKKTHAKNRQTN